jgi:CheY-like chemotaxis protein
VAIIRPLVESKGLLLIQDCRGGEKVLADRLRLRQVLVNLLSNAVKYNRAQGQVRVRCERRAGRVRVSVADTGRGIPPAQVEKLFQPFERLGAELGQVEGTGIGLALSRQLAELMDATLGAESTLGAGSVFWIDLQPAGAGTERSVEPRPAATPVEGLDLNILYVEDRASNIELVETFLARFPNIHLSTAQTGQAGLAMARARQPDIILLDIHLPGMDGYEVLQALKADRRLRGVPVVALSADAMPHDIERGLAAGFDRYIAKPADLNELLSTIGQLVRERQPRTAPALDDSQ